MKQMIMKSNITRDHIALEVMKVLLEKSFSREQTLWNKIKVLFGGGYESTDNLLKEWIIAERAYRYADAMIAERDKNDSESD